MTGAVDLISMELGHKGRQMKAIQELDEKRRPRKLAGLKGRKDIVLKPRCNDHFEGQEAAIGEECILPGFESEGCLASPVEVAP